VAADYVVVGKLWFPLPILRRVFNEYSGEEDKAKLL